jgi:excisionase family DNA binding protein
MRKQSPPPSDADAYTVEEFCARHRITKRRFYELISEGRGPRLMRLGRRPLISREAAAEFRRALEIEVETGSAHATA